MQISPIHPRPSRDPQAVPDSSASEPGSQRQRVVRRVHHAERVRKRHGSRSQRVFTVQADRTRTWLARGLAIAAALLWASKTLLR